MAFDKVKELYPDFEYDHAQPYSVEEFDLKGGDYIGATFNITYQEIIRDFDDDAV